MPLGRWLGLILADGLTAAWDSAPLPTVSLPMRVRPAGTRPRRAAGTSHWVAVEPAPVLEALRERLRRGLVPASRIERAVRATDALLGRAVRVREDGTAFVTTGDIAAMWLRDSAAQVAPLLALVDDVPAISTIVTGVLRTQVEQVLIDPRANAFNGEPSGFAIRRDHPRQSAWVFERKYAVDSLAAPLWLAWRLWCATGSLDHVDASFRRAARAIVALWRAEQEHRPGAYRLRRRLARREDSLSHGGVGAPVGRTGMTWSAFRPSDDACRYGYHVPSNALAAVSLERLATMLEWVGDGEAAVEARSLGREISAGIRRFGLVDVPGAGTIYAYEVDGLGRALRMDDANIPSCLSLPYLGFCAPDDPVYRTTRAWALSPANPTYGHGRRVRGLGSTHTRRGWVWPMGIITEGLTAGSPEERESALRRAEATVGANGLLHESVHPSDRRRFSRRWFSWADMLYVELVLRSSGWVEDAPGVRLRGQHTDA